MSARRLFVALMLVLIGAMAATTATAQTQTVYNNLPRPLPGNVGSEGPEAYAFAELGDGLTLTANTGTIGKVTVIMSSWACYSGNWFSSNCITPSGATFSQPLTINIYSVNDTVSLPAVGSLLGTITQTFDLPYRPSSDSAHCPDDYAGSSRWYNSKDKTCYHGLAVPATVNYSNQHIPIPTNGKIVVTVAYNTTHYGPNPIGESASCFRTSAGCPYDSLNISTDTTSGTFVSAPLDANGIFVNYRLPNSSCTGAIATGVLLDDTAPGCWAGYHPQIAVRANTNAAHGPKGLRP
jgi:hypothetical protein